MNVGQLAKMGTKRRRVDMMWAKKIKHVLEYSFASVHTNVAAVVLFSADPFSRGDHSEQTSHKIFGNCFYC